MSTAAADAPSPACPYRAERDAAVRAAHRAAASVREHAGAAGARQRKDLNDYVTEADRRAQALAIEVLTDAFPDYDVLAEEGAALAQEAPVADGHRWIVDPIDGTTNFMHAVPPYAVSIALQREEQIVVGVVLEVSAGDLFAAVRGDGAYLNGAPIAASRAGAMREAVVATGFPYRVFEHLERYGSVLMDVIRSAQGVRRHGAASIDLARVAAGRFGAFFETGLKPWDVAAGSLLVEEAGGRVTDYEDSGSFLFGGQILATNGALHGEMLSLVRPMRDVRT